MAAKTAVLFGATGLVGGHLLKELINDANYNKIKVFSRNYVSLKSYKVDVIITDLKDIKLLETNVRGDVVFCCLGTTINKAGSKEAFKAIDLDLPVTIARLAERNNIPAFVVISSIGADNKSGNFYLRTKGEMEKLVSGFRFENLTIVRPSLLLGTRKEVRIGESAGKILIKLLNPLLIGPLKKYAAVHANDVAVAMKNAAIRGKGKKVIESSEILKYI